MTEKLPPIKIPGLPDGWRAVAYRTPLKGEKYMFEDEILTAYENMAYAYLIVEKIQPRRIVLEETDEANILKRIDIGEYCYEKQRLVNGSVLLLNQPKIWREVVEQVDAK